MADTDDDSALGQLYELFRQRVGRRLRRLREERGLTLEHAASQLGVSGDKLEAIERGALNFRQQLIFRVMVTYGVQASDLFTFPDEGLRERLKDGLRRLGDAELRRAVAHVEAARGPLARPRPEEASADLYALFSRRVARRLQAVREERQLRPGEAAFRAGGERSNIHKLEDGSRGLSLDTVFRLAKAYAVQPSDLVTFPDSGLRERLKDELRRLDDAELRAFASFADKELGLSPAASELHARPTAHQKKG